MHMGRSDYARIEAAIQYLDGHVDSQPSLADVAKHVGLSEFHFQRLFQRWAGLSPKRFLQFATAEHARTLLRGSGSVLDVSMQVGLSSPGRLHDLILNVDAVTPGDVRRGGEGLSVRHGFAQTPFGECLVALTERGVCALSFIAGEDRAAALGELRARWPRARHALDAKGAREVAERLFAGHGGRPGTSPLSLHLRGTNFQIRVWEALLRIPEGAVSTYTEVARAVGMPSAMRAVGNAVGQNPVAFLIPCHRVLRQTGAFGGYRWGVPRKRALLAWEQARHGAASEA